MANAPVLLWVLITTFLQTLHVFEEIGAEAYKVLPHRSGNPLTSYLRIASLLVAINFAVAGLVLLDNRLGYYLAFYTVVLALSNTIVHVIGYMKTRRYRGSIGAGVYTSVPLGVSGTILLIQLLRHIA